eukprot:m.54854 g.54854  ORF g.54854 m.54854 type:complete len:50 (-) comp10955_c0_seq1:618-767(-)
MGLPHYFEVVWLQVSAFWAPSHQMAGWVFEGKGFHGVGVDKIVPVAGWQ